MTAKDLLKEKRDEILRIAAKYGARTLPPSGFTAPPKVPP